MVRLEATLDIYSGNPNPSWELSEDKAKEFTEMPGWMDIMNPEDHGLSLDLGYRGFIVSVLSEESEKIGSAKEGIEKTHYHPKLPNTFRIYGSKKSDESNKGFKPSLSLEDIQEKEKWLLDTMKTSPNLSKGFDQGLKTFNDNHKIKQLIEQAINDGGHPQQGISETLQEESRQPSPEALASCNIWSAYYNPSFWNDSRYQGYNNCYNYAMNMRTNTFAQPGRAHGCNFSINCGSVSAAARCDGVVNSCGGMGLHTIPLQWLFQPRGKIIIGIIGIIFQVSGDISLVEQLQEIMTTLAELFPPIRVFILPIVIGVPINIFCGYYYGLKDANIR